MRNTTLCYIERGEQYLMLHRVKKEHDLNHDKWVGIGGKFEADETPDECLLREAYEETGLTLTDWRCRGVVTFFVRRVGGRIHVPLHGVGLHRNAARVRRGRSRVGGQDGGAVAAAVGRRQNFSSVCWRRTRRFSCSSCATRATRSSRLHSTARRFCFEKPIHDGEEPYMRRKQQIQAMQQELALLRQTIDSGKELAALRARRPHPSPPRRAPRGGGGGGGPPPPPPPPRAGGRRRRAGRRPPPPPPVFPNHFPPGGGKGAQACARPARRPAGDRGRYGRGRGHRAGKGSQGEKAPPLRQESDRKMLRRPGRRSIFGAEQKITGSLYGDPVIGTP